MPRRPRSTKISLMVCNTEAGSPSFFEWMRKSLNSRAMYKAAGTPLPDTSPITMLTVS